MITLTLPPELEAAVLAAAERSGRSTDDYLAAVCAAALLLENDRARVDAYRAGTPAVSAERADAWLAALAEGNDSACPR